MSAAPASRVSAHPPAGLDRRFYAFALDRLVAWPLVVAGCLVAYRFFWRDGAVWAGIAVALAVMLLVALGFAAVVGRLGTSPGKAALGLRVVAADDGTPIGLGRALRRTLILAAAGLPTFGLGTAALAQTALLDPGRQRRGWHDRVSGSIVVDVRPVAEEEEPTEEAPHQVVNLTAMRLAPVASVGAPERAAPHSGPPPSPSPGRHRGSATPLGAAVPPPTRARPASSATEHTAVRRPAGGTGAGARWRVMVDTGESFAVEGLVLVGRRPEVRPGEQVGRLVPLPSADMSLSKTHAQLEVAADGSLVVTDRGSTNGSLLVRSGVSRELPAGRPTVLLPGDAVRLGDRTVTVAPEG